jgi:four helix bundle protein
VRSGRHGSEVPGEITTTKEALGRRLKKLESRKAKVENEVEKDLEPRTKRFALAVIDFVSSLPRSREADVLARQLLRSATSIGANYREANRAVSRPDFANKIGTIQKEAAETQYWIELLIESGIAKSTTADLHKEATELVAIFTAIGRKLKG